MLAYVLNAVGNHSRVQELSLVPRLSACALNLDLETGAIETILIAWSLKSKMSVGSMQNIWGIRYLVMLLMASH